MRKPAAAVAATANSVPAGSPADRTTELVCLALVLALLMLAVRIASIW